ncbi:hypothetical protein B0H17DRAFT_1215420 [Mycena rosella]|uniref:Uncharacterized protein n=1 Tax=Mycena rosella TaxID=1033263 RepID=A0AAD7CHF7_MYCRO|nr:hypothetical protein B0H17DRAFT_1215420 [Mycena rosella]
MPMETWDGDTDKMSAQDFLRVFHRDVKVKTSSADKAKAFKNYLAANSDADDGYQALPAATKLDMDLIDVVIEAQYPAESTVKQTATEYGMELLKCKLMKEELGTKVKVADREVWAHHAWGTKMLHLALKAGVSATTTYIKQVRVKLPGPLHTKIGKTHANWPVFIKAVQDVDTVELELDMKDWYEEKEQRDKAETPSRAPEEVVMATYSLPTPCAPYAPQACPPMTIQPPLEGDQRRILLKAIAHIIHHPDTEAGRCAHADQQQEWYRTHGSIEMSINTPYPLRLGRPQKAEPVLGCDEPSPEDESAGPEVRSDTLTPMYAPSNSHVVDLYTVGIEDGRPKRASVPFILPFICGIEVEGLRGELVRIRALEDDGAMVNVMCTTLYEMMLDVPCVLKLTLVLTEEEG